MQREPAIPNPENFEYIYYVKGVKHKKLLKDMSDEELVKVYRSLKGREKNYTKVQKDCTSKIKKINDVMNSVIEVVEDIRGLNIEDELLKFINNRKETALSQQPVIEDTQVVS